MTISKVYGIYNKTKSCISDEKRQNYKDMAYEALNNEDNFKRFEKISYAIRLMYKGIKKNAFNAMFKDNYNDLEFAYNLICKKNEKVFDNLER